MNFNKVGITNITLESAEFKNKEVKGCLFGRDGIFEGRANLKQINSLKSMGCKDNMESTKTIENKTENEHKYKGGR
jgi:hypothetical protein